VSSTLPAHEASFDLSRSRSPDAQRKMSMPPAGNPLRTSAVADRLFGWAARAAALFTLAMLAAILLSLLVGDSGSAQGIAGGRHAHLALRTRGARAGQVE
jgi:phosphate transport system permease protein